MTTKTYAVTDKAGPLVACREINGTYDDDGKFTPAPNQTLALSDIEAEYELMAGSIALSPQAPAPGKKGTKPEGETEDK